MSLQSLEIFDSAELREWPQHVEEAQTAKALLCVARLSGREDLWSKCAEQCGKEEMSDREEVMVVLAERYRERKERDKALACLEAVETVEGMTLKGDILSEEVRKKRRERLSLGDREESKKRWHCTREQQREKEAEKCGTKLRT